MERNRLAQRTRDATRALLDQYSVAEKHLVHVRVRPREARPGRAAGHTLLAGRNVSALCGHRIPGNGTTNLASDPFPEVHEVSQPLRLNIFDLLFRGYRVPSLRLLSLFFGGEV